MDNKIAYAIVFGVILFAVGLASKMFANQEGLAIILYFASFFIIGFIATGVKRGFLLGFVLSIIFQLANTVISSPETLNAIAGNVSVMMALIVLTLINSAISGALSTVGGFLGKKIFN